MPHLQSLRRLASQPLFKAALAALSVLCAAPGSCGGGGGLPGDNYVVPDPTTEVLSTSGMDNNVQQILNEAANEADALGTPAVIAVVDRLGNVLAVGKQAGAPAMATITSNTNTVGGLEGESVPTTLAAISKAITAAYLSSGGNAFSTRTANFIVQDHYPPGTLNNPGGPLFGVQFSQLACSDLIQTGSGGTTGAGPHAAPLGLAAAAGGLPLYINGVVVGGIGVMSTSTYSINDPQSSTDETIALAGQSGFEPSSLITAPNIDVGGQSLAYIDQSPPSPVSSATPANPATLVAAAPFYSGAAIQAAQQYGTLASGIVADSNPAVLDHLYSVNFPNLDAFVLVDPTTMRNRFDPNTNLAKAPTDGNQITPAEAEALVGNALSVAAQTRAAIRIPTNSNAQVTASVVDLDGNVLAVARLPDAPIFGIDVSLQKARSAVFFSRHDTGSAYNIITTDLGGTAISKPGETFDYYLQAQSVGDPSLFNSGTAFSELAIGDLARPYYPDGQQSSGFSGPLSLPIGNWSVFSTGLQVDLVAPDLLKILGGGSVTTGCGTTVGLPVHTTNQIPPNPTTTITQVANGLQIFSGGFPIYRPLAGGGSELIGALGISGDGIQQDAQIAYLGIGGSSAIGVAGVPTVENAPAASRADTVSVEGQLLQFILCPFAPFITANEDQVACP